jgi:hypothetical protein
VPSRCQLLMRSLPPRRSGGDGGSRRSRVRFTPPRAPATPCGRSRVRCSPGGRGG